MFTPQGQLRGKEALAGLFQALFAEFSKPGSTFEMKVQSVHGDYAYIVREGKILAQSFAGKITPKD